MIYNIKRFSETKTFSYKHLRLESKLFGGMRGFYRKQAQTVTKPDRFKPGPDNRTQAQKNAILKANGISVPSALDRGIAGFEHGMTSLGTSMGKGISAVGSVLGKAGSAVGQGASAVGRAAQSAEQSIMSGVGAVGRGVKSGATSVGQALSKAGTSTGKAIQTAGQGIGRAAQSVGSGISGAFRSVGNFFRGKPKTTQTATPQAQPKPAQPAQSKPQVTGGGTQQAQPKTTVNPQQPAQPGGVGQWFKNAGQNTWNGVKTAGKIGMIGGTAAAGLGAYALYKTATSDSDD